MSSSTSNSESSGAARPTGGATGGSRSSVVLRREQQIRAAALHLAEVNEEEHDAGESDCNSAATADNDDKYNHALTAPSGADGDEDEPDRKGKSGSPSDMQPHGSKKRSTPPSDVPPSPMVTPPIASQSAPRPQSTTSNTPMKPSPPSVGKKGSPAAAASPGSGTGSGGVPHVYHDYGHVPDEPGYVRKKTGGVTQPFPEKLYEMLESEGQLRGDVVEWLPHGRAFIVRRPKDFTDKIMPKYFRQSK